jgi:dethiobiotin synthetase
MSTYIVASTGTGVGKTFTSCALLHAAWQQGRAVRGLKPVISGWDETDASNDVQQMLDASRAGSDAEDISYYRLAAPLSPHMAAARAGVTIDMAALTGWCEAKLAERWEQELALIETAGGVMTPLTDTHTMLDFMVALNLPVILVVGSYLGTISHTLTALAVLRARGLRVAALVMSETEGSSTTLAEAEAGLAPFVTDIPLRIVQPRVSSWHEATALHALMEAL